LSSYCLIKRLLKKKVERRIERWDDEEEDVSTNTMTLRKRYCKPKEEETDRIPWRTRFGRDYEPVVR
jgi:hypothetical protein